MKKCVCKMKRFVWLVCLGVLAACLSARGEVRITVSDQASFDRLPKDLSEALASEENDIVVDFRKGVCCKSGMIGHNGLCGKRT